MDPNTNRFLSVNGTAEVIADPKQIKKNWSAAFEKWFPAGLAEEDLVLVAVYVSYAEFWDTPNSEVSETLCFLTTESSLPDRPRLSVS
jgi:general stress protein 26